MKIFTKEPIIHSHITDVLPEDHPLAYKKVYCDTKCGHLVHAGNNECMRTWIETEFGNYCTTCFCLLEVMENLEYCLLDGPSFNKRISDAFSHGLSARKFIESKK